MKANMRANVQAFGGYLTAMVLPNIGAFIAWGFITALFIPTGWMPNEAFGELVGPMITYLLPLLIGYTGGQLVGDKRGAVAGAIGTMGVIVGANIPMFVGAMIMGPLSAWVMVQVDKRIQHRIPSGFEMVVNNFSLGIIGMILCLFAYHIVGPSVTAANLFVKSGIEALVATGFLPLLAIINEPAKVLFLNNAIDQGIYYPLGLQAAAETGKSIFFMVASNPGPGLGMLLAYAKFGQGLSKRSAPSAIIIHFFGGIHELYFPYVLMKPIMIVAMIAGAATGIITFNLLGAGLVAGPSPGSIFSYLALTPKGGFLATISGVTSATIVSFLVASAILKMSKSVEKESEFEKSVTNMQAMKAQGTVKSNTVGQAQALAKPIAFIAFACDAGMGSSAMGASIFKRKLTQAGIDIQVQNFAIENVPNDVDIVITHESLEERAIKATGLPVITIKNFLNDPALDELMVMIEKQG
ncbi:PTS mannitol transporter subunit IICBA [Vibrio sp. V27_P1S3P104]|uniref:PTS mannitol transporter subunit IICBA n=1 Tax=Vibrio TaxID=662 RepID=UPI000C16EDB1|nr:PTS mannitol transporter subunit IICB [Vibrio fujianensis]NAW69991.1 PTS mannitol transporter subunit IICBA [Vibrio sp. V28_P6S34P95]NAX04943.1 PTS mannitol transporter subunit IICBA [Vibrio sp. V30_P3S12P165]NAX33871.1 PTS mannitol transporter subunit IICBA [Vibrio sp. V29_P1S30P107]NAX37778.1 PTS mannitol transporter subunit IICBA [Vibrio sp. V27_P1S3P104]NAX41300.1 PTS mannitol transporter subunit IICBA [Vibrio sp. V26_P1S5P106]NNN45264.1 PTS mannitol transporter subunit IICB [Vibrio sp